MLSPLLRRIFVRDKLTRRFERRDPSLVYPEYSFGKWTYGIPKIYHWGEGATLKIGAFCSIAEGVQIFLGGEHRTDWVSTFPFSMFWKSAQHIEGHPKTKGDVNIGNDVWIGHEAVLLSGITIGDGAVIGARAVVGRDVPPYQIVAGNPAMIIRGRFDDRTIGRLLSSAWWEWDDTRIERALPYLMSHELQSFLDLYEAGKL